MVKLGCKLSVNLIRCDDLLLRRKPFVSIISLPHIYPKLVSTEQNAFLKQLGLKQKVPKCFEQALSATTVKQEVEVYPAPKLLSKYHQPSDEFMPRIVNSFSLKLSKPYYDQPHWMHWAGLEMDTKEVRGIDAGIKLIMPIYGSVSHVTSFFKVKSLGKKTSTCIKDNFTSSSVSITLIKI